MSLSILKNILTNYPQILSSGHIIICSDNYSTEYKSWFTFTTMYHIASKNNVTFTWFYGKPGHGRGLVDAMNSFDCKGPLKHSIITEDKWYNTATEVYEYLKKYFKKDPEKHHLIDEKLSSRVKTKNLK